MDLTPVGQLRTCADCDCDGSHGHKAIVARKVWHGRFPFDAELCAIDSGVHASPDQTKYLTKTISASVTSRAYVTKTGFIYDPSPAPPCTNGVEVTETTEWKFEDRREAEITVGRNSGVISVSDCISHRLVSTPSGTLLTFVDPSLSFFPDILCISGGTTRRLPWIDIITQLDACAGQIYTNAAQSGCSSQFVTGTPEEIEAQFTASGPGLSQICTCSLSATEIYFQVEVEITASGEGTDTCGNPYSYSGGTTGIMVVRIQLGNPYDSTDVNDDVNNLLSLRSLSDDTYYTWHEGCVYPYIFRDEVEAPVSPDGFSLVATISEDMTTLTGNPCSWTDPNASSGGHSGSGYTGNVINGSGAISEWFWAEPRIWPWGAFKLHTNGVLHAAKYAEILKTRPSHNWFRPCGASDRALTDDCSQPRYTFDGGSPNGWPICGRVSVASATQSGGSVDIVLDDPADGLVVGDKVDFDSVGSLGTNVTVDTVTDSTHFSVTGTVGTYFSGGYVQSTGSPSYTWNDDDPKGDYLVLEYQTNARDYPYAVDHSLPIPREFINEYGMSQYVSLLTVVEGNIDFSATPRIVAITPNGETWSHADVYPFDSFAMPLQLDDRYGAIWIAQIRQRMPDPIDSNSPLVEARASVPAGAPALPVLDVIGGCCSIYSSTTPCPYVHILSIAELVALGSGGIPQGKVEPPLFVCFAFDDD